MYLTSTALLCDSRRWMALASQTRIRSQYARLQRLELYTRQIYIYICMCVLWRCTCVRQRGCIHVGAAKERIEVHIVKDHMYVKVYRHTSSLHSSCSGRSGSRAVAHCAYASASRRHDDGDDTVSATAANKLPSSVVPPLAHAYGACRVHRTTPPAPPPPPRTPPPAAAAAATAAARIALPDARSHARS